MTHDTQDDDALVELAHRFAERELRPVAAHYDETEQYPHEIIKKAAAVGLNSFDFPEEFGGGGVASLQTIARIEEEIAWGDMGLKQAIRCGRFFATTILVLGTDEQKKRWVVPMCGARPALAGTAVTEPGGGSDIGAMRTHARRVDGGYVLNGQKTWCSNAPVADVYSVFATVEPGSGFQGITAFVIEKGDPGFTLGPKIPKMGIRAIPAGELFFSDCFVPEDRRIGAEGSALFGLLDTLDTSRVQVAASAIGLGRAALEYAIAYAQERRAFGHAIHEYQAVSFRLVDAKMKLDQARLMTHHAAWLRDQGKPCTVEASMAKVAASEAAWYAAWACCQTLGSYSYSREYPAERWLRNAKVEEIYEGTNDVIRLSIATAMFGAAQPA